MNYSELIINRMYYELDRWNTVSMITVATACGADWTDVLALGNHLVEEGLLDYRDFTF